MIIHCLLSSGIASLRWWLIEKGSSYTPSQHLFDVRFKWYLVPPVSVTSNVSVWNVLCWWHRLRMLDCPRFASRSDLPVRDCTAVLCAIRTGSKSRWWKMVYTPNERNECKSSRCIGQGKCFHFKAGPLFYPRLSVLLGDWRLFRVGREWAAGRCR